jgi:hypothetical protein
VGNDFEYHLQRARSERNIAYRAIDPCVSDAHMTLSVLHLQRAMLLREVRLAPVANVTLFRSSLESVPATDDLNDSVRAIQVPN